MPTGDGIAAQPGGEDGGLGARVLRWVRRATVAGLAISLAVHALVALIAWLWVIPRADGQLGGPTGSSSVDFAVMSEQELSELEANALPSGLPPIPELTALDAPAVELLEAAPEALSGSEPDSGAVPTDLGAGNAADGIGITGAAVGAGGASFFGVEAVGRRFAFVVDRSGSMSHSGKFRALQQNLAASVAGLGENASFFVTLYSSDAAPLGGRRSWVEATDGGRGWARREIAALGTPEGGTDPLPGFELVFQLRPRPDAIYFMTDGEFNESIAMDIVRMNSDWRVPVHCITFVNDDARVMMEMIARNSGGTYTHVEDPGG